MLVVVGLAHARLTRRSSLPYSTSSLTSCAATASADAPDAQALIDTDSALGEQEQRTKPAILEDAVVNEYPLKSFPVPH